MLPLIFVVLVSIDTYSKRQKTTHNLLESNLWFSGRSALDQLETQFNEIEKKWLNVEYFSSLLKGDSLYSKDTDPGLFLIDQDFQVIYPAIGEDKILYLSTYDRGWKSDYKESMSRAETAELTNRNYPNAVKNYQTSLALAKTTQQEALAIEGLARSHLAGKN